jgi:hypothetical protein
MIGRRLFIAFMLLAAVGCGNRADIDQLRQGRLNLRNRILPGGKDAAVAGVAGVNKEAPDLVYLEDWVIIAVNRLDNFLDDAKGKPVTLYIEGIDTGVEPSGIDRDHGLLTFVLHRDAKDEKTKDLWHGLLYGPLSSPTTSMNVSTGVKGDKPLPHLKGAPTVLQLHKIYTDWTIGLWAFLLTFVAASLFVIGAKSDLLRDGPTIGGTKQSFSLARTQMAWWFFLILVGYVFIWLVTGDRDTIPVSLLGLMGISAATALTAVAISSRGSDQTGPRKKLLDDELTAIAAAIAEIDTQLADPSLANIQPTLKKKKADLETRRTKIYAERAALTSISPSTNWWRDLLTEDNGAFGLDRMQVMVWTVVLGLIFLNSVLWDLSMPEFNTTLLALMGISSGTYIGFKVPSKKE